MPTNTRPQGPKPFVFVLMPFHSSFDDIYTLGIKAAAEEVGAYAERVDEQFIQGSMVEHIWNQISKADVIVADMSTKNPNVFYEVGYAHALGKLTVLLTQSAEDIPFDLKHWQHLVYGGSISGLKRQLVPALDWALKEAQRQGSPLGSPNLDIVLDGITLWREPHSTDPPTWQADFTEVKELKFAVVNNGLTTSPFVEACYVYVPKTHGEILQPTELITLGGVSVKELPSLPVRSPHRWLEEPVVQYKLAFFNGVKLPPGGFDFVTVYLQPSSILGEFHEFTGEWPCVRVIVRLIVDGCPHDYFAELAHSDINF